MKKDVEFKKEHYIGLLAIAFLISIVVFTDQEKTEQTPAEPKADLIKETPKKPKEHIIGFESLPAVYIGDGVKGSLAGMVHGWKNQDWKLMADYQWDTRHQPLENVLVINELILKDIKLIGFKLGEFDYSLKIRPEYKNNIWTVVSNNDTISFYTDEMFTNDNIKKKGYFISHFYPQRIEGIVKSDIE